MALKYFNGGSATGSYSWAGTGVWWSASGQSGSTTAPVAGDCVILESNVSTFGGCKPSLCFMCNQSTPSNSYCGGKTVVVDSTVSLCGGGTSCFNNNSLINITGASTSCFQILGSTTMVMSGATLSGASTGTFGSFTNNGIVSAFNSKVCGNVYRNCSGAATIFSNSTAIGGSCIFNNTGTLYFTNTSINLTQICATGGTICFDNYSKNCANITCLTTSPTLCFYNNAINCGTIGVAAVTNLIFDTNSINCGTVTPSGITVCNGSINCGSVASVGCFSNNSINCGCVSVTNPGTTTNINLFSNSTNCCCVYSACRVLFSGTSLNCGTICGNATTALMCFCDSSCNHTVGNITGLGVVCFDATAGINVTNCGTIASTITCVIFNGVSCNCGTTCSQTNFLAGNNYGKVCANANFCNSTNVNNINYGLVTGNAVFGSTTANSTTYNCGTVQGTASFVSSSNTGSGAYNLGCVCGNTTFCCQYSMNCASGSVGSSGSNLASFICASTNFGTISGNAYINAGSMFKSGVITGNACFNCAIGANLPSINVTNGGCGTGALICGDACFLGQTGSTFTFPSTFTICCVDLRVCGGYRDSTGTLFSIFNTNNKDICIVGCTLTNKPQFTTINICSNDCICNANVTTANATINILCYNSSLNYSGTISNSIVSATQVNVQPLGAIYSSSVSANNICFYSSGTTGTTCDWSSYNASTPGIAIESFCAVPTSYYKGTVWLGLKNSATNNCLLSNGNFTCNTNGLSLNVNGYICSPTSVLNTLIVNYGDNYACHSPNSSICSVCFTDNSINCTNTSCYCLPGTTYKPISSCFLSNSQNCGITYNAIFNNNINQNQYTTGCVLSALQYIGSSCISNQNFTLTGTNYFGVKVNGCIFDSSMNPLTSFNFLNNSYNSGVIPNKSYFCNSSYNSGTINNTAVFCQFSCNTGTVNSAVFNQYSFNASGGKYNNLIAYNSLQKGISSSYILAPVFLPNY